MIGMTFAIPVLFIVIGLILMLYNKDHKMIEYYFIGTVLTCLFGMFLIIATIMVPVHRAKTSAWMEKYDAVRVVWIDLQKKGDCLERIGYGIKIAELNGELMVKKYYATCWGGMFTPYYPSEILILRPIKP